MKKAHPFTALYLRPLENLNTVIKAQAEFYSGKIEAVQASPDGLRNR